MTGDAQDKVTVVTRNDRHGTRGAIIELVVYGAILYLIANPDKVDDSRERARAWAGRFLHRVSVWQAQAAIRSLPETDEGLDA